MKFAEMTATQLAHLNRNETVVIVPIAAVEQHGPHMPTGTDFILCDGVTSAIERALPENVLLTPCLWLGASSHHLRFGATLNTSLETYIATLYDLAESLASDGFVRIFFVNGHGGNVDPLRVALREVQPAYPHVLLAGGSYWAGAGELLNDVLEGEHQFVGHACEFETSMMLHLRPELVNSQLCQSAGELISDELSGIFLSRDMRQRTEAGYTGRPDLASSEKGEKLFTEIVNQLIRVVQTMLKEPLGTTYDDFRGAATT